MDQAKEIVVGGLLAAVGVVVAFAVFSYVQPYLVGSAPVSTPAA